MWVKKKRQPEQKQEDMIINNVLRKPKVLYCGWSKAMAKEDGKVNIEPKEMGLIKKPGLYSGSNREALMGSE